MRRGRPLVLVADDEANIRRTLASMLDLEGMDSVGAKDGREALELAAARKPDAVLMDLQMPEMDGMTALRALHARFPELPVIVLTAHGTIERAVEAVRAGAFDFLEKPPAGARILAALRSALRGSCSTTGAVRREKFLGGSPAAAALRERIARVAPKDATVLITGENGTGKEIVAEALHAGSPRARGPHVRVNCAAIPETLFDSELFGHEKGAFTGAAERRAGRFERASGGTLFLDEVAELPAAAQAKLLRALQEGEIERVGGREPIEVDVRVIAATNRNLEEAVASGAFREDLYYRLNVIPIPVPALRDRIEDLPELLEHFFRVLGEEHGAPGKSFDAAALRRLRSWPFPGNVRELKNLVERCVVLVPAQIIGEKELLEAAPSLARPSRLPADAPLRDRLEEAERRMVRETLERMQWRMTAAAKALGLERSHLYRKMRALGIERPGDAAPDSEEPAG